MKDNPISRFGLILLLFLVERETDIKKLKESGKSLIFIGLTPFFLTALLSFGFFMLMAVLIYYTL